jgi:sugar phosphate isomerase/epimerase
LLDVHIKDVSAASKEGRTVEIGRGVIDIPRFLRTLLRLNYKGTVSFEFEKDADDPLPGVAESLGYVRGVLAVI